MVDVLTDHHRLSPFLDIDQFRCINRRRYHAIAVCDDVSVLDINMSQPLPVSLVGKPFEITTALLIILLQVR